MDNIYIYGAGNTGRKIYSLLQKENEHITFIDNNVDFQKELVCGREVISFNDFVKYKQYEKERHIIKKDKIVIAVSNNNMKMICDEIDNLHLSIEHTTWMEEEKNIREKEKASLKNSDFSIISNNCFGGFVYKHFNLPYLSPTIGLFFLSSDYIRFLERLRYYLSLDLKFVKVTDINNYEKCKTFADLGKYPIGILDDINIHFLHYTSEEEAYEKWSRRNARINFDKIIVKNSTQNFWDISEMQRFNRLNYTNKILFTNNHLEGISNQYCFNGHGNDTTAFDEIYRYHEVIDMLDYLNNIE